VRRVEAVNAPPFLSQSLSFSFLVNFSVVCCKTFLSKSRVRKYCLLALRSRRFIVRIIETSDDDLALVVIARRSVQRGLSRREEEFSRFVDVEESRRSRRRENGNETSSSSRRSLLFFFSGDGNDGNDDDDERRQIIESRR